MSIKLSKLGLLLGLLLATKAYSQTHYCTNSGRLVSSGMTSAEVEQLCGKPSQVQLVNVKEPTGRKNLSQWRYSSKQLRAPWEHGISSELLLSFDHGTLIEIQLNGQAVNGAINCFGQGDIQKGDSSARVLQVCGKPNARQTYTQTLLGEPHAYLTMQYDRANGLSAVIMRFKDDKLISITYG